MNLEERRQFVREHRTAVLGYPRKEHGPAMSIVYYVMDGDEILVSTMAARAKAKAVGRSPKVSMSRRCASRLSPLRPCSRVLTLKYPMASCILRQLVCK